MHALGFSSSEATFSDRSDKRVYFIYVLSIHVHSEAYLYRTPPPPIFHHARIVPHMHPIKCNGLIHRPQPAMTFRAEQPVVIIGGGGVETSEPGCGRAGSAGVDAAGEEGADAVLAGALEELVGVWEADAEG